MLGKLSPTPTTRSESYCFLVAIPTNVESPSAEACLINLANRTTAERFELAMFSTCAAEAFHEFENIHRGAVASVAQR